MIEEIKQILQNTNCFADSRYKEDIIELFDLLIGYSLESGINVHDLREQMNLIKFEIDE